MAFQVSPGVAYSEVDLSTTIPTTSVSDAGFIGYFTKGPIKEVVKISSENELVEIFGKPTSDNSADWFTAASFLSYGGSLQIVNVSTGTNAYSGNLADAGDTIVIENEADFESTDLGTDQPAVVFVAKSVGQSGNTLSVTVLDSSHSDGNYPDISENDEIHVLVKDGDIVKESWLFLNTTSGEKGLDGKNIYYRDVINAESNLIYAGPGNYTTNASSNTFDGGTITIGSDTSGDYDDGTSLLADKDKVELSILISGDQGVSGNGPSGLAASRKDCVAFYSPKLSDVLGNGTMSAKTTAVTSSATTNNVGSTSYSFMDSGWKKMYDKYNDTWVNVPLNGDVAGLCVATDESRGSWYSPAGFNRGQIKNCAGLLFDPDKTSRDTLYKNNVNPVVAFPGEGYVLFGDKTRQLKPSAFDRLNVRRLFITLEKTISNSAKYSLFEFNDEFTRGQFKSTVEPYLRNIKAQRGIVDYLVVCDESNNTPAVIDNNEFVGDIFIKPSRSVNFIQLNFVAVRTGVNFQEVVGAV